MSKLLLCFIFFFSCSQLLSSFSNSTKPLCPHDQTLALLQLKQSFSIKNSSSSDCDSYGVTSYPKTESWKKGSDCCSWDGVTCDKVTGHVIGLDLSCSWLFGIIHSNSTLFLFPRLRRLNLAFNDFNYSSVSAGFGRFSTLMHLNLSYSGFSGLIAPEISHLSTLVSLDLSENYGVEFAPHGFNSLVQNLTKLQKLHLRGRSKIKSPFMSLRIIDLAHNDFEGDLPEMYLRSLKATMNVDERNMTRKYMGEYYYQDSVMVTIKGLEIEFVKILKAFTTIDLSSNKFQGEIPESIGNLNSLRGLNLSHNNLTGHIPSSFGNLKLLESLDLSSNKLIGRIPQELTSLTFLEVLNLSQNHLTGFIPRGNQFDTFENDSYNGNSGLCGFPLLKKCTTDETLEPSQEVDAEFEGGFDWKITLMGYGCGLAIGFSLGCLIFSTEKPKWLATMVEENIHKKIKRSKRCTCKRGARRN
ncbi:receptor-like protein 9DC3 [Vitis riparia]|uniref:receptor-like protein 9DC3 n=1 Tax=Vitis riparia TaxID=96939 RepID=UPI00155A801C|nr:receptor-like protein 9DC3 [Vitis riparia]